MKVLLLSGAKPGSDKFGGYSYAGPRLQPYNIMQIAAVLRSRGTEEIDLIDTEIEKPEIREVLDFIRATRPDLIGISVYTKSLSYVYELCRRIKESFPAIIIVAGGPHVTIAPERLVLEKFVDYAVAGEADYAFSELVEALDSGKNPGEIANLIYLDRRGELVRNPLRPYIQDLDGLPFPDFELIRKNLDQYRPQIMTYQRRPMTILVTSRGCIYHCAFCPASGIWKGAKWRAQSPGYVVNLMEWLNREYGVREICFNENTFAFDRRRTLDLTRKLADRNLDIVWTANVNLRHLDEEVLGQMKKSGCWLLSVGIESGDDRILKEIKKPLTVREAEEKVRLIHKMGIKVRGYFMLGNLGETAETMDRTIALSRKLPLFSANYSVLIPIQGSAIYRDIYGTNHIDNTGEDDNYSVKDVVSFTHPNFTMAQLDQFQRKAFRKFFLNFRQIFRLLASINTPEDIRKYTVFALHIFRNLTRKILPTRVRGRGCPSGHP